MSKSCTRFLTRIPAASTLASTLFAALTLAPASAQETTQLQGIIAEEGTGRPVRSALVTLVGTDAQVRSGPDGAFTFTDVRVGPVIIRVQAPGYPTVVDEVTVSPEAVVLVQMLLPRAAAVLDEILVTGMRRPDASSELGARTAADLVARHVPHLQGFTASFNSARGRAFNPPVQLRGPGSLGTDGEPVIILDGVRISGVGRAMDVLRQIPASQIKEIQILRGPSSAHAFGSPAGAISIRTVSGAP
jgi:hypothetical protein